MPRIALVLVILVVASACDRSKIDGSAFPVFSSIIGGLSLLLLISLITGLLKI